jgi:hypothetical protein
MSDEASFPPLESYLDLPRGFRDDIERCAFKAFKTQLKDIMESVETGEARPVGTMASLTSDLDGMIIKVIVSIEIIELHGEKL